MTTSTTQLFADSMVVESLILEGGTEGGVVGTVTPAPDSVPKSYSTGKIDPGWLPEVTPAGIGAASESTQVIAGAGLAGGGNLASNVTLSVKYGKTADAACVGNDARLSDTRIPTPHATSHLPGGTDIITPAALGAVATTDSRLSDTRVPKTHAATHATGGTDAITPASIGAQPAGSYVTSVRKVSAGTGLSGGGDLTADRSFSVKYGIAAGTACQGNDARLSNARTPTAHKSTHASGGADALTPADIGAQPAGEYALTSDSRLSDARTPTTHATTHGMSGTDAITSLGPVAEKSQALGTISGSVTVDLSAGLSVSATIGGAVTLAFTGVPTGGAVVVVLRLTNGGNATVTWPATIAWAGSKAPALTAAGTDVVVLSSEDGGVSWMGNICLKYGAA